METMKLWDVMELLSYDAPSYGYCETCDSSVPRIDYCPTQTSCVFCAAPLQPCTVVADVLDAKRLDHEYSTLVDDIRDNGMFMPVVLEYGKNDFEWLVNGHHRVAAYEDLGIYDLPVTDHYPEDVVPQGLATRPVAV